MAGFRGFCFTVVNHICKFITYGLGDFYSFGNIQLTTDNYYKKSKGTY